MKKIVFSLSLICLLAAAVAQDRITGPAFTTRSEVIAVHGMACTSQPLCTQVALDILKKGGNAIDAAIAANAALGLMEPTGNGIGGDLYAIVWDAGSERLYGLNASGRVRNVKGAFRVRPKHAAGLRGARVLLVDDVFTTGATAYACARALREAGATEVRLLSAARRWQPFPASCRPALPAVHRTIFMSSPSPKV